MHNLGNLQVKQNYHQRLAFIEAKSWGLICYDLQVWPLTFSHHFRYFQTYFKYRALNDLLFYPWAGLSWGKPRNSTEMSQQKPDLSYQTITSKNWSFSFDIILPWLTNTLMHSTSPLQTGCSKDQVSRDTIVQSYIESKLCERFVNLSVAHKLI